MTEAKIVFPRIHARETLLLAGDRVEENEGGPGVDGDRVAQSAAALVVTPTLEREFETASFGFRKRRSVPHAVAQVRRYYEEGYRWVVERSRGLPVALLFHLSRIFQANAMSGTPAHAERMTPTRRVFTLLALVALFVGCRTGGTGLSWQSSIGREHRLVGRIWDVAGRRFVDEAAVVARLTKARYVLLGEKHDNPDHHVLQARLIRALTAAGRRPAVAFEMFTPSQASALARYLAAHPHGASGIGEAVNWTASGWPAWAMYEPIARAALDAGLPILAANLDNERVRAVSRQGVAALDAALVRRHGLDQPLPVDVREVMAEEIRDSHCGHAPENLVSAMIGVQRARDAQMAEALLTAPGSDGAVLIAGAGHVRSDFGVPSYLRRIDPGAQAVGVALVEVDPKRLDVDGYAERFGGPMPFDYVWFTPAVDDEDPCEKFRKSLERLRR